MKHCGATWSGNHGRHRLVFVALLMLFAFFDLVDQIGIWAGGYRLRISWYCAVSVPNHVYELFHRC